MVKSLKCSKIFCNLKETKETKPKKLFWNSCGCPGRNMLYMILFISYMLLWNICNSAYKNIKHKYLF